MLYVQYVLLEPLIKLGSADRRDKHEREQALEKADMFGLSKLGERCIRYAIVNYSRFNEAKLVTQLKESSNNIISDILQLNVDKTDEKGVSEQKVSNTETFMLTLAEKFQMSIDGVTNKKRSKSANSNDENQRNRINSH
eukprot:g1926.t1